MNTKTKQLNIRIAEADHAFLMACTGRAYGSVQRNVGALAAGLVAQLRAQHCQPGDVALVNHVTRCMLAGVPVGSGKETV